VKILCAGPLTVNTRFVPSAIYATPPNPCDVLSQAV
jgi:hypothetical protein